jgi:hypothetical protein
MHYGIKGLLSLLLTYLIFTASTCVENAEPGPTSDDFTKLKREQLGDLLAQTIEQTPAEFTVLDRRSKRDSIIVTYLQSLYDQVTMDIRRDRQSSISDRWDAEREWNVVVLDDENRFAFSLPGGHFYISTGFLKSLSKGYEVYYLMAFEAVNISDKYLIDNLISEYGTATLFDVIDQAAAATAPSLLDLALIIKKDLAFTNDIIKEIDKKTGALICDTSIFDRFGVKTILESLTTQEQWRDTRPSYSNRLEYIANLDIKGCGSVKSTGLYEKLVLKNLPK